MNVIRFILILLAVYLSLLTTIFAVFGIEKYFISELIIFALLAVLGLTAVVKQYCGRADAHASSMLFFSITLINMLFLYFMPAIGKLQPQILYVMLISGLFGLVFSFARPYREYKNREQRKHKRHHEKRLRVRQMSDEIPKVMSEVYDIIEDTKKFEDSADKESSDEKIMDDTMVYGDEESPDGIHEDESSEWEKLELEGSGDAGKKQATPKPKKIKKSNAKSVKAANPGKFVASSISRRYHKPDCDWAKKIVDKNAVWFKTKAEADRKKYKPCNCVKK